MNEKSPATFGCMFKKLKQLKRDPRIEFARHHITKLIKSGENESPESCEYAWYWPRSEVRLTWSKSSIYLPHQKSTNFTRCVVTPVWTQYHAIFSLMLLRLTKGAQAHTKRATSCQAIRRQWRKQKPTPGPGTKRGRGRGKKATATRPRRQVRSRWTGQNLRRRTEARNQLARRRARTSARKRKRPRTEVPEE